jgi:hypothetical protein
MRQALKKLQGFEWGVIWNPLGSMGDEVRRLYLKEIHVAERLYESLGGSGDTANPGDIAQKVRNDCGDILAARLSLSNLRRDIPAGSDNAGKFIKTSKEMQEKLANMAGLLCKKFLDPSWKALPADDAIETSRAQAPDAPGAMTIDAAITTVKDFQRTTVIDAVIQKVDDPRPPGLSDKSLRLAEEFVACVYSTFITIVFLRIRWLVFSSVVIYTTIVFSSTSYPFQPIAGLRDLALLLFLLGGIVVGYVYGEHDVDRFQ